MLRGQRPFPERASTLLFFRDVTKRELRLRGNDGDQRMCSCARQIQSMKLLPYPDALVRSGAGVGLRVECTPPLECTLFLSPLYGSATFRRAAPQR